MGRTRAYAIPCASDYDTAVDIVDFKHVPNLADESNVEARLSLEMFSKPEGPVDNSLSIIVTILVGREFLPEDITVCCYCLELLMEVPSFNAVLAFIRYSLEMSLPSTIRQKAISESPAHGFCALVSRQFKLQSAGHHRRMDTR